MEVKKDSDWSQRELEGMRVQKWKLEDVSALPSFKGKDSW
jgi:hypothetical protein